MVKLPIGLKNKKKKKEKIKLNIKEITLSGIL